MAEFAAQYFTNELSLPVVDETGLQDVYDIATTVELRTEDNVKKSIEALGVMGGKRREGDGSI